MLLVFSSCAEDEEIVISKAPYHFNNVYPAKGSKIFQNKLTFKWTASSTESKDKVIYKIWVWEGKSDVYNGNGIEKSFDTNQGKIDGLYQKKTYSWQVVALNEKEGIRTLGDIWFFDIGKVLTPKVDTVTPYRNRLTELINIRGTDLKSNNPDDKFDVFFGSDISQVVLHTDTLIQVKIPFTLNQDLRIAYEDTVINYDKFELYAYEIDKKIKTDYYIGDTLNIVGKYFDSYLEKPNVIIGKEKIEQKDFTFFSDTIIKIAWNKKHNPDSVKIDLGGWVTTLDSTYLHKFIIGNVFPTSYGYGDTIVIKGKNFGTNRALIKIKTGKESESPFFANDTMLKYRVPKYPNTSLSVEYLSQEKHVLNEENIVIKTPSVSSTLPKDTIDVGDQLTIYGDYFGIDIEDIEVTFGSVKGVVYSVSFDSIVTRAPLGGQKPTYLKVRGKSFSLEKPFVRTTFYVTELPKQIVCKTPIEIKGKGFGTDPKLIFLKFNPTSPEVNPDRVIGDTLIIVTPPDCNIVLPIQIRIGSKKINVGDGTPGTPNAPIVANFTVKSVSAPYMEPYDVVTIKGEGFGTDKTKIIVKFGNTALPLAAISNISDTEIQIIVPEQGVKPISVTKLGVKVDVPGAYTVFPYLFTEFKPKTLNVSGRVQLIGKGFGAPDNTNTVIKLGAVAGAFVSGKNDTIVVDFPIGVKTGKVSLSINKFQKTNPDDLTVIPIRIDSVTKVAKKGDLFYIYGKSFGATKPMKMDLEIKFSNTVVPYSSILTYEDERIILQVPNNLQITDKPLSLRIYSNTVSTSNYEINQFYIDSVSKIAVRYRDFYIYGKNFRTSILTDLNIKFNNVQVPISDVLEYTNTRIKVKVPKVSLIDNNLIMTSDGITKNNNKFKIEHFTIDSVTKIAENKKEFTIWGKYFGNTIPSDFIALFNKVNVPKANILQYTDNKIRLTVPEINPTDKPFSISFDVLIASTNNFTIRTLRVNDLSPANIAYAKSNMDILGLGFGTKLSDIKVSFKGIPATINSLADDKINVEVPIGATFPIEIKVNSRTITYTKSGYYIIPFFIGKVRNIDGSNKLYANEVAVIEGEGFNVNPNLDTIIIGKTKIPKNNIRVVKQDTIKFLMPYSTEGNLALKIDSNQLNYKPNVDITPFNITTLANVLTKRVYTGTDTIYAGDSITVNGGGFDAVNIQDFTNRFKVVIGSVTTDVKSWSKDKLRVIIPKASTGRDFNLSLENNSKFVIYKAKPLFFPFNISKSYPIIMNTGNYLNVTNSGSLRCNDAITIYGYGLEQTRTENYLSPNVYLETTNTSPPLVDDKQIDYLPCNIEGDLKIEYIPNPTYNLTIKTDIEPYDIVQINQKQKSDDIKNVIKANSPVDPDSVFWTKENLILTGLNFGSNLNNIDIYLKDGSNMTLLPSKIQRVSTFSNTKIEFEMPGLTFDNVCVKRQDNIPIARDYGDETDEDLVCMLKAPKIITVPFNYNSITPQNKQIYFGQKVTIGSGSGLDLANLKVALCEMSEKDYVLQNCLDATVTERNNAYITFIVPNYLYSTANISIVKMYMPFDVSDPSDPNRSRFIPITDFLIGPDYRYFTQRDILLDFYKSMNGSNWGDQDKHRWDTRYNIFAWEGVASSLNNSSNVGTLRIPSFTNRNAINPTQIKGALPNSFSGLTSLTSLTLQSSIISSKFPITNLEVLGKLINLEYLFLGDHRAYLTLPDEFNTLISLKELVLDAYSISEESGFDFSSFTGLLSLNISSSQPTPYPTGMFTIPNLEVLDIENSDFTNNGVRELPDLSSLTRLKTLILKTSTFTSILNLNSNINIESIEISNNNSLRSIPDISNLTSLKTFTLKGNSSLTSLPILAGLPQLKVVELNSTRLNTFDFGNVPLLEKIIVNSSSKFVDFPSFTSNVLDEIDISNTGLNDLTGIATNAPNLVDLYIYRNKLTSLPLDLNGLSDLETISAFENEITTLDVDFSTLSSLKYLILNDNDINSLPSNFGDMTEIEEIIMNKNELPNFVVTLSNVDNFSNLTELTLSYNQIVNFDLAVASGVSPNLQSLTKLNLSSNKISSFDVNILRRAINLETLDISDNPITSLVVPRELCARFNSGSLTIDKDVSQTVACE